MNLPTTLLTSACLCAAANAGAAEWSAAPVLNWTLDHDTNRLLTTDGQASEGGYLQFDLLLRRATGASSLSLQPHVEWQRYTERAAQNTNNQSLRAAGSWRDDRSVLEAEASYVRDNALNNQLADTGFITGDTERRAKDAALSWSYERSDRNTLSVQASYSDVGYQRNQAYTLLGYKYPSVAVTQSLEWSPRTAMELMAYASRLIPEGAAADSDSIGARIGFSRALTTRIHAFFSAGLSRQIVAGRSESASAAGSPSQSESGYIGRFELTRDHVNGRWRLFAERSISASGYGSLVTRNDVGLSFDWRLSPRWSATFGLRSLRNDDIALSTSGERRRYERAEAGFGWQATRMWRVNATVASTRARQAESSPLVAGWNARVSATWSPQRRLVSR